MTIALVLFGIALAANAIAFIRHWRMMRVLNLTLNNLIETQKEFDRVMRERGEPGWVKYSGPTIGNS